MTIPTRADTSQQAAPPCWCFAGASCDRIEQHVHDKAYEDALVARVRAAANELIDAAGTLGWGSGEAALDADTWLTKVAIERGLLPPLPPPPSRREEATRAAAKAFRRIGERDGFRCRVCSADRRLTVDHVIAVVNGGSDDDDNFQILCGPCNSEKGTR